MAAFEYLEEICQEFHFHLKIYCNEILAKFRFYSLHSTLHLQFIVVSDVKRNVINQLIVVIVVYYFQHVLRALYMSALYIIVSVLAFCSKYLIMKKHTYAFGDGFLEALKAIEQIAFLFTFRI